MAALFRSRKDVGRKGPESPDERRQLTVLFYDIVGSTEMLQSLEPEEMRDRLAEVHDLARSCILAESGSLEQVLGDGGMAYFGYPEASEDAAFQAVRSGLRVLEQRAEWVRNGQPVPDIRIGVATSLVAMSANAMAARSGGLGAVGVAPNLAARLQSSARPNSVLVGQTTRNLTWRAFDFEQIDGLTLKGFPDVQQAYSLIGERDVGSRFEMSRDADTTLVAREEETAVLERAWQKATLGSGGALLLLGEAGIGKSRLVSVIGERAPRRILLQCQPATSGEPLFAIIQMYEAAYRNQRDPDLVDAAIQTAELVQNLEDDLSLSSEIRRKEMIGGCVRILRDLAQPDPCLIVAEDLQWADEVTLDVLTALGDAAAELPLLLLATSRPEPDQKAIVPAFLPMPLGALSKPDAMALARSVIGSDVSEETLRWIVDKSDGNPLFTIELATFTRDKRAEAVPEAEIRAVGNLDSLRDLLTARLDAAGRAKRTALVASVIGRDAPFEILTGLSRPGISRTDLDADLDRLVQHGINDVFASGNVYSFRHALMRDAAYESQPGPVRRDLHNRLVDLAFEIDRIADAIPDEVLAEHCLNAGRLSDGIDLLITAAERAIRRAGLSGPREMLERALDLSRSLDDADQTTTLRLRAITLLGPLVTQLDGPRAAADLYEEGQSLCADLPPGARGQWFPILWGWWFTASDLIEQNRRSAILIRDIGDAESQESRLQALHCGWATLFDCGSHDQSLASVNEGLTLYDPGEAEVSRYRYGHDAKVCGLGERAQSLWMQGDLPGSRQAIQTAEAWADETGHPGSILHALDMAMLTAFYRRDFVEIDRLQKRIAASTTSRGFTGCDGQTDDFLRLECRSKRST